MCSNQEMLVNDETNLSINDVSPIADEKKSEALDFIIKHAFRSGFGSLDKSELDAILFATLLKYSEKQRLTDLELSKFLKITQRRLKYLKEKVSVKYLQISRIQAIDEFVDKLKFAKKDTIYIDIPIRNVAVKNEIEGILDENEILLHTQLNEKIFRLRLDDLLELIIQFEVTGSDKFIARDIKRELIENLRKSQTEHQILKNDQELFADLKSNLAKSSIDIGLEILRMTIPGGGLAASIIEILMRNFGIVKNV